jgi:hypothetical protein
MTSTEFIDFLGSEVVTEEGILVGWVTGFDDNAPHNMLITSSNLFKNPFLSNFLFSTYFLSTNEIISFDLSRVLVSAGSEEKIAMLNVGILATFNIHRLPWKKIRRKEYHIGPSRTYKTTFGDDDCLGSGVLAPRPNPPGSGHNSEIDEP